MLGQENKQKEQQAALDQQRAEIEKNRALIEELKRRNIEARETSRGVMVNLPNVNFEFDSADLTRDGRNRVNQIADIIKRDAPNRRITVEGHASQRKRRSGSVQPTPLGTAREHRRGRLRTQRRQRKKRFLPRPRNARAGCFQRHRERTAAKPTSRSRYRELVRAPNRGSAPLSKRFMLARWRIMIIAARKTVSATSGVG